MKINTLVEFIWNSNTKEYEEVYSESYDYNGELALALDPPDDIAKGFGLDESDYAMYFPKYDDWKKDFAEDDYGIATEDKTASDTLLEALKTTEETRLTEKAGEAGSSLAGQIGSTYSQASTSYLDATATQIGQQVSFTSGASGRQKEEAFKRTQSTLMEQTTEQNLAYTSTMSDIKQSTDNLESQYAYDSGKIDRDWRSSKIDKDYKIRAGEEQWEDSIYDALGTLGQIEAWG